MTEDFRAGEDAFFDALGGIMRHGQTRADDENPRARMVLEAIIDWDKAGRPTGEETDRRMRLQIEADYDDVDATVIDATEHVERRVREQGHDDA